METFFCVFSNRPQRKVRSNIWAFREHGSSLCYGHSALSQLSSADATLVAPKRERSYPTQNLLFPAHPWHLLKHWRGHRVSQLKEIIWFILQQHTVSTKQQTPPQREIQRQIRICSRKASAVLSLPLEGSWDPSHGTPLSPVQYPVIRDKTLGISSTKLTLKQNQKPILPILSHLKFLCQDCFTSVSSTRTTNDVASEQKASGMIALIMKCKKTTLMPLQD